jgi:tetratricopeptide (TPR) repeat protein
MRVPLRLRLAPLLLLGLPALLSAQTAADATLCAQLTDDRKADARARGQSLAQGATAQARFLEGCIALADGRWDRAAEAFERAVRDADGSAVAHYWLARAYAEQARRANVFRQPGLARRTKTQFERAVQLDPDYLDARDGLLQFYLVAPGVMGGSQERAAEQAAEIRRRSPYRGALASARIGAHQKDTAAVARIYRELTTSHPDSNVGWASLFTLQLQQRRYDEAEQTVAGLLRARPGSTLALYLTGRLAAESGRELERGEQALRRYLAAPTAPGEPSQAAAHWRLGAVLERRGQRDAARGEYQRATALDPALRGPRDALARLR